MNDHIHSTGKDKGLEGVGKTIKVAWLGIGRTSPSNLWGLNGTPGWGRGRRRGGRSRNATPKEPSSSSRALRTWGRSLRVLGKHSVRCLGHVGLKGLGKLRRLGEDGLCSRLWPKEVAPEHGLALSLLPRPSPSQSPHFPAPFASRTRLPPVCASPRNSPGICPAPPTLCS